MFDALRKHVLAWTTAAASTLTIAQLFSPSFMDFILDWMVVGLVALAAYLAKSKDIK